MQDLLSSVSDVGSSTYVALVDLMVTMMQLAMVCMTVLTVLC